VLDVRHARTAADQESSERSDSDDEQLRQGGATQDGHDSSQQCDEPAPEVRRQALGHREDALRDHHHREELEAMNCCLPIMMLQHKQQMGKGEQQQHRGKRECGEDRHTSEPTTAQ
jgi:hypothetical protein